MPYLELGEFYSEFGNFTVDISAPEDLIIAASGEKTRETISNNIKTTTYTLNNTHDFAWFASKDFLVQQDTLQLPSKLINVFAYYYKKDEKFGKTVSGILKGQSSQNQAGWENIPTTMFLL